MFISFSIGMLYFYTACLVNCSGRDVAVDSTHSTGASRFVVRRNVKVLRRNFKPLFIYFFELSQEQFLATI